MFQQLDHTSSISLRLAGDLLSTGSQNFSPGNTNVPRPRHPKCAHLGCLALSPHLSLLSITPVILHKGNSPARRFFFCIKPFQHLKQNWTKKGKKNGPSEIGKNGLRLAPSWNTVLACATPGVCTPRIQPLSVTVSLDYEGMEDPAGSDQGSPRPLY